MTTYHKEESVAQSQPLDPTSEATSHDRPTDRDRIDKRIQELKAQREEILRQVRDQREAVAKLEHEGLNLAMNEFLEFFDGYTNYFFSLSPDEVIGHGSTYESVLNRALDNTRQLWQQLSLAINQRYNPTYSDKLKAVDEKAENILQRVGKVIVRGTPILYFDKSFRISRHPYQTNPLLGISLDRFDQDSDASLAHELGHHVFWNNGELEEYAARLDFIDEQIAHIILVDKLPADDFANPATARRTIRSRFDQYSIWTGWIEEVFADVFGTLITGPLFAKSAQDVLIRERLGRSIDLIAGDSEHPIHALRPFIATSALKAIAGSVDDQFFTELNTLIEELDARWQPIWKNALHQETQGSLGKTVGGHLEHAGTNERPVVTLEELRQQITPMVQLMLEAEFVPDTKGQKKKPEKLLTILNHWGKGRTANDVAEIRKLRIDLEEDPISDIESRVGEKTSGREFEPVPSSEESLFGHFLSFVEKRRGQLGGSTDTSPVWPTVLEFDLTLDRGVTPGCHKHLMDGTVVPCRGPQ